MPPKRKVPPASSSEPKERQSKLAKEHKITAREEQEFKEAFDLFSEAMDGEKYGIMPIHDVQRAMAALNLVPTKKELSDFLAVLDPEDEGFATYEAFVAICSLKLHMKREDETDDAHRAEVDEAFELFVGANGGEKLTLAHLKRVALTLKQDIDESLLKDMIQEANGGAGINKGVGRDEFEEVMKRAGVWK